MSLSGKVEEAFGKINHAPSESKGGFTEPSGSKFSLDMSEVRDYITVIVCFAIALGAIFLLVIPQYRQLSVISSDFTAKELELAEVRKQSQYLEGLASLQDELESKIELADQALPKTEDRVPYTLDQLIQIAEQSSVEVDALSLSGISELGDEGTTGDVRTVLIQFGVIGGLEEIIDFFQELESARTLVDVKTFSISMESNTVESDPDEEGETTLSTTVNFKTLFILQSYLKPEDQSQTVDLSTLANSPNYDAVFEKLTSMDFYETTPLEIEFGRDNPFDISEGTPSINFNETQDIDVQNLEITPEGELITNPDQDSSGFE